MVRVKFTEEKFRATHPDGRRIRQVWVETDTELLGSMTRMDGNAEWSIPRSVVNACLGIGFNASLEEVQAAIKRSLERCPE